MMNFFTLVLLSIICITQFICTVSAYAAPPATYEANSFTSWAKERVMDKAGSGAYSRKGTVHVPLTEDDPDFVYVHSIYLCFSKIIFKYYKLILESCYD